MTSTPSRRIERGTALVLALILLGVLTVVGTAAVSLSSRERVNASAYSKMDSIYACANAATAKFWAELGAHGNAMFSKDSKLQVTSILLPDGTRLTAPAHYDTVTSNMVRSTDASAPPPPPCTNCGIATIVPGTPYTFTAHCRDASGRELEVEIGVKFDL